MKSKFTAWSSALVLGTAASVGYGADESDIRAELEVLRSQMQDQQAEIQRLRASSEDSWMNERRAEEVRALVHDVLGDAESRASFQQAGLTAGHRDGYFFVGSDDGNFLMNVGGQVQTRYIYNQRRDSVMDPEAPPVEPGEVAAERRRTAGFEVRRAKLGFHGHIFDPRLTYMVRANFQPTRSAVQFDPDLGQAFLADQREQFRLEEAWFGFEFADGWQIKGGQFKAPFLREELVYSKHQLAVERSLQADLFSAGYTQGVQLGYTAADMFRAAIMLHEGSRAANTGWERPAAAGATDLAIAARGEFLVMGNWAQFDDFTTWSHDEFGVMLGAAFNYENAAGGARFQANDVLRWTLDASVEMPEMAGFNAFGAVTGNHPQGRNATPPSPGAEFTHVDQWGLVGQAGIFVIPDKLDAFLRWEYLDLMNRDLQGFTAGPGEVTTRKAHTLTFGTNYYLHGHAAKASLDLVWFLDPVPQGSPGAGVLPSGHSDQFAIRGQFQFLF